MSAIITGTVIKRGAEALEQDSERAAVCAIGKKKRPVGNVTDDVKKSGLKRSIASSFSTVWKGSVSSLIYEL